MSDDSGIALQGVSHVALVCSDMARTVEFYDGMLGMPLVKTTEVPIPGRGGQHFFFDVGNGDLLAFFMVPGMPGPAPGIAGQDGLDSIDSAIGSMHHLAFKVSPDVLRRRRQRLAEVGIDYVYLDHKVDGTMGVDESIDGDDDTFAQSVYFKDPDGISLEFCAWGPAFDTVGVDHEPMRASDTAGAH